MTNESSRGNLSGDGRLQGAVIMSAFASMWEILGVSGLASRVQGPALFSAFAAAVLVAAAVVALTVRLGTRTRPRRIRRVAPSSLRVFRLVNIGQTVAIVAAVFALGRLDLWDYIPLAVCLVVGLHFLPLARSFAQPQYWWTGGLLTFLALACALLPAGGADARLLLGFGAALALWATAAHVAHRG